MFNIAIFLAAAGITILEMSEASAVGIALYADTKRKVVFGFLAAGVLVVLFPTALIGQLIELVPIVLVRLFSATLLLYFGQRLLKSAARSFMFQRIGFPKGDEEREKGAGFTAFSVGTVEAFEAAIVLVALYPNGYLATLVGLISGILVVIIFSIILHSQIRKIKQAIMKASVSSLLFTFSAFWYAETFYNLDDLFLIPIFIVTFIAVYYGANMISRKMERKRTAA